ncbi:MAG: gamma-glutamyl-gamma-aminobutyrate hydrolase family protein [Desulfomonile sp.]
MSLRLWLILLVAIPLSALAPSQSAAKDNSEPAAVGERASPQPLSGASQVWIVVNLFTGQTSKQAEIVRDKLIRLGAEGRGIIMPFKDTTVENIARIRPAFLALSPNGIPWCRYKGKNASDLKNFFNSLKVMVEEMQVPVIGICGGHQALALAFGGKVGPIRGGEDDCFPYGHNPTERGRHNVYVLHEDALFRGMGPSLNLVQNHYDEVKRLPPGFVPLAENKLCPYQIIKHPTRPAYGVQAHTEYWLQAKPDGGTLLRNFLDIARSHNRLVRDRNAKGSKRAPADENG